MALVITKKTRTILLIVLAVLVVGGGGFLFWRINQEDTVAPEDSEAGGCKQVSSYPGKLAVCSGSSYVMREINGYYKFVPHPEWGVNPDAQYGTIGPGCYTSCSAPTPAPTKYTLKYTAGTGGTISGTATQSIEKGKSGSQVTAVPNDGYTFTKWSDSNTSVSRTDSNVQANITVTAQFEAITYTLSYSAGTGGTLSGESTQTVAYGGNGSSVTAVPNDGYKFTKWSDSSTSNPRTDTNITKNITVTATFEQLPANEYTLTYVAGDNGSIQGSASQTVEEGEDGTEVTAVGDSGYIFSKWNDNSTENPRQDINVTKNISVTALFVDDGQEVFVDTSSSDTVPQTGVFDTVLGRISVGVSFIFLGGLVSQYSKFNYLFNSITEKQEFRREIRKQKRVARRRGRLEDRFK